MPKQLYVNNASTKLAAPVSNVGLSFQVTTGEGAKFPTPTGGDWFLVTLIEVTSGIETAHEIVKVTARTDDIFTIVRAQEGTAAQTWAADDWVQLRFTAAKATELEDHLLNVANPHTVTKTQVGLSNVDNTSDVDKPVSTAQSTAIGLKLNSSAFTDAAVTGKLITGYISGAGVVADTDTILQAINKLNGNTAAKSDSGHTHAGVYEPVITTLPVSKGGTGVGTLTGLVKASGTSAFAAATVRTDYAEPTNALATGLLKNTTATGAHTIATVRTDYAEPTTALATGLLKNTTGTGAHTIAVAGTDFQAPIGTITGVAKGNGANALTAATAGTDYVAPTGSDGIVTRQMFKDCGMSYYDSTTTNALDYVNGSCQRWAPNSGAQSLTITNWPPTGNLGELLIQGVNLGAATITWPTINWVKSDGTFTTTFSSNGVTLQTSGTDFVVLWTRDAGTTIYGKIIR